MWRQSHSKLPHSEDARLDQGSALVVSFSGLVHPKASRLSLTRSRQRKTEEQRQERQLLCLCLYFCLLAVASWERVLVPGGQGEDNNVEEKKDKERIHIQISVSI